MLANYKEPHLNGLRWLYERCFKRDTREEMSGLDEESAEVELEDRDWWQLPCVPKT